MIRRAVLTLLFLSFSIAAFAAPSITSLTPSTGAVGASITIAGSGFGTTQGTSTVKFNGTIATATSWSSTSITATVPAGATSGTVVVTVSGVASNGVSFTVAGTPSISSLSPTSGTIGTSVTITGTNFGTTQGSSTVKFNGVTATPTSWSATSIKAPVPTGATSGNVVVHASGVDSNGVNFTIVSITSLSPNSGAVGASIIISGSGFGSTQGTSTVKFNGTTATATSWSATSVTATVPSGATTGNVVVTVGGTASNGASFTVVAAPSVTSLSPTSGTIGTAVTIAGTGFGSTQGSSTVKFNGTTATVTSWSATSIKVTVPSGATSGNVVVHASGVDSNGVNFTIVSISSLMPNSGAVGASVVIAGSGFGAIQGSSTVKFNTTTATSITSWSATSITAVVPTGATTGNVVVTVGGTASNGVSFTVVAAPSITSLSPTTGSIGTVVTITGTGFGSTQGSSTVKFNGTTATSITSWSATSIKAAVPSGATSGNVIVHASGVDSNGKPFTLPLGGFTGTGSMVTARFHATATLLNNGKVLMAAGDGMGTGSFLATAELYDPVAGSFTSTGNLNLGRDAHAASLLNNGSVLIVGGQDINFHITASAELYNPATGIFTTTGSMNTARRQATATLLSNGLVLVAGGQGASNNAIAAAELYNPATGTFSPTGSLNTARHVHTATLLNDGTVFMVGGVDSSGSPLNSAEIYNPATGAFTVVGSLASARSSHTATLLNNGTVLIAGGTSVANAELYNPATQTFSQIGAMQTPRSAHTATLLSNGTVLIAGGSPSSGNTLPLNAEIYDPATSNFSAGANLATGRQDATATLLADGTVLVAGGDTNTSAPIASAEIYHPATLTPAGLQSISIAPASPSVLVGQGQRLAATGTFTGNTTQALSSAIWSSSSTSVATVSNDISNRGQISGLAQGSSTISACTGSVCSTTTLTVAQLSVTSVSPASGAVGTVVTITGTGFGSSQGSSTVSFNGVAATPQTWSSGTITVPVPANATSGNIVVTVSGVASNGSPFTVIPVINSLAPSAGAIGTSVTLSGSGFGPIQNSSIVSFNGMVGTPSAWNSASITVPVPATATSGNVAVTVGGVNSNGVVFTLYPIVSNVSPSTGAPGSSVTITGKNFSANTGIVTFNGVSATVSSWSDTSISVSVPSGAGSGNVIVANAGLSSNGVPFTVGPIVYSSKRSITLNHNQVSNSDQINFPVLVSGTFSDLATTANGGQVQNANAYDIAFSSDIAGTNKLDHEIESYDPVTGTITCWVRIPVLSHSTDTVIFLQYGSNMVITSQENRAGVWDSNYQMVLHLDEAAAPYRDSTSNAYASTGGGASYPAQGQGKIGKGQVYNSGAGQYIAYSQSQSPNPTGAITMEAWIKTTQNSGAGQVQILGKGNNATLSYEMLFSAGNTNTSAEAFLNSTNNTVADIVGTTTINDNNWHHIAVAAPSTGNIVLYTDGQPSGSLNNSAPLLAASTDPLQLGASCPGCLAMFGTLDEVRISNSVRSADWVATEYNNQNSPSSFASVGQQNAPVIIAISPSSGEAGSSFTITGNGFTGSQGTVTLNGNAATVSSWSSSSIVAIVPFGTTSGPVVVTAGGVQSNGFGFTVLQPTIASVSPNTGNPGTSVTIAGVNFDATQGAGGVTFGGISASIVSWSATSITAYVPVGATSGNVVVTAPNGVASNGVAFSVTDNLAVNLVSPATGPVGTTINIIGGGFGATQGSSILELNGVSMLVSSWNENQITAVVPAGASTGTVNVTIGSVTAQSSSPFLITTSVQIADSFGRSSSYTSSILGGVWLGSSATGSGCSSCTVRGNISNTIDNIGNVLSTTDELGHITTYTYDASNNVTSVSQPLNSNQTATTSFTYNSFGEPLTATDPLGNTTTNTYDTHGNLLSVTTPAPNSSTPASVTQFAYDSQGELTQITDPLNHVTTLTYTPAGLIATITDAQQNVTTYQYDAHGNRTAVIDALQHQTSFAYDALDRLTTITYPDQTTASFAYDSRGRRTSITDQNGNVTTYTYDDADRLTQVKDAANNVTQYAYDAENNLLSITDANSHTTSFSYDAFGRVTQATFPSTLTETYLYDATGNLVSKTDRTGHSILYVYDALNRLTHKAYPDSTGVDYIYDLAGKIKQVTDPTGTYGFAFDNMGRLIGTTTQYSFLPGTPPPTFSNSYAYDAASNRTSLALPDGTTNTYAYDTLNRLTNLTNSLTGQFGFGYDTLSRRTGLTQPNGVNTSYSYDPLSRLLSILHKTGATTIDGASYSYDNAGNRTAKTNQLNNVTEQYAYDAIYQLKQVTQGTTTTESYTYDAVGNRLSSLGMASYSYNSSNELTSTPNLSFSYDNNGSTLSKTNSGAMTQYAWDFENRLSSVILPGSGQTVTFKYDPFGRRIQKSSSSGTTNYLYDGPNSIEELNAVGAIVARYTQAEGVDEPLAQVRSGVNSFYGQDGLGSVTSLISSTGSVANTYDYDSFGNLLISSGTTVNPFQYTGRDFDPETGLGYYRARYYDPTEGRFLSEDPLRFSGGGPDFYAYVNNSPTNFLDSFGEQIGVKGDYMLYLMTIMYLKQSPLAAELINELEKAPEIYIVNISDLINGNHVDPSTYSSIYWNPHQALCVKHGGQSPAIQLFHEMVHVWQRRHHVQRFKWDNRGYYVDLWEQPAVERTNPVAVQLGEPTRGDYFDSGARPGVLLPTTHGRACGCK